MADSVVSQDVIKGRCGMGDNYSDFAMIYDQLMSQGKYNRWGGLIKEAISRYGVAKDVAIDIACGTGNITYFLLDAGFGTVVGIDNSKSMLTIARKKLPQATFIHGDIRQFQLSNGTRADFAVSFYDSLNYLLTDKDMTRAFGSIGANIRPGAIFLFDMNTREHVEASQRNSPRNFRVGDTEVEFVFGGNDRFWTLDIKLIDKATRAVSVERHMERGYNVDDIVPLLEKTGYLLLDVNSEEKKYEDGITRSSRLYFTAQKK